MLVFVVSRWLIFFYVNLCILHICGLDVVAN